VTLAVPSGQGKKYRKRPICRDCGRKIGNAWQCLPSLDSYKSYSPVTNTYLCTKCRYKRAWVIVRCPVCARGERHRLGQIHRLAQWKNGSVIVDDTGVYIYLCMDCASKAPNERQRTARHENAVRLRKRLYDRIQIWHRPRLETQIIALLGSIPADMRQRVHQLSRYKPIGVEGYRIWRWALGIKGHRSSPGPTPEGTLKGAHAPKPRKSLRLVLIYLDTGLPYQCVTCLRLAHLRSGHVKRRDDRIASGLPTVRGVLCADCGRNIGWQAPRILRSLGRKLTPAVIRHRVRLLIQSRLGGRTMNSQEWKDVKDMERRLRESPHPWCQRIVAALDQLKADV